MSKQCALHIYVSGGQRCVLGEDTLYEFACPIGDGRKARRSRAHEFHVHVKAHLTGRVLWCPKNGNHVVERIAPA